MSASAHAALPCVTACQEDFPRHLATIILRVLVIHAAEIPEMATSKSLTTRAV
jgi:hypothetical protein